MRARGGDRWAILNAVLDAVLVVDSSGRILFANRAGESLFGYAEHALIGQPVEVLVPPAARGRHPGHRRDYAAHPRPRPMGGGMDLGAVRRDGSWFPAEISLSPMPTTTGRSLTVAVVRDLTTARLHERIRRESQDLQEALAASDQRFRMAFEDSSLGMLMINARPGHVGSIVKVNRALCDLLARPPQDLLGRDAAGIFLPEDAADPPAVFEALLCGHTPSVHDLVRRVVHADGHSIWVAITAALVRDPDGAPDCLFVSQVLDITERRRARQEARRRAERDRRIALVLQESLHPTVPSGVGLVPVAARYQPAGEGELVGGDWHDVVALPDGRIGLTVGDVAGHGIESAATMSRLRYAVRMLATAGAGPAQVITRLNQVMLDPDRPSADIEIATVVHAQLDPATGRMTYCSAGHPPLIHICALASPGSASERHRAQPIPAPGGPPIGVLPEVTYRQHQVVLAPGDILIGYTDGLVERRGHDPVEAISGLLTGLTHLPEDTLADVEAVADQVLRLAPPGGRADDTAVMVIAIPRPPAPAPDAKEHTPT